MDDRTAATTPAPAWGTRPAADADRVPRHWILQCNPEKWDVWSWLESRTGPLHHWTVVNHLKRLRPGDRFALWLSGAGAGVYALGTLTSSPYLREEFDEHWAEHPERRHVVDVRFDRFLFDEPLSKRSLVADQDFAGASVVRQPFAANPIPLTARQWSAIERPAVGRGRTDRPGPAETVVTSRPVGGVPETTTATGGAGPREVGFPEAKLVKGYQEFLGRELVCLSALLPTGERLVCDLFDATTNTLIEAKASNARLDVRTALGQLLDYRHHIRPDARLAVLLPSEPSPTIVEVLRANGVRTIHRDGDVFRESP